MEENFDSMKDELDGWQIKEFQEKMKNFDSLDFSCADAAGADVLPPDTTAFNNADLLDIRPPDSFRFPVGMAYIISHDRLLAAHGTDP